MASLWSETQKLPIIARRKRALDAYRRELAAAATSEEKVAWGEAVAKEEQIIKARKADERFHVVLRHVGADKETVADRKKAWADIVTKYESQRYELRRKCRKKITEAPGGIAAAVQEYCDLNDVKNASFADVIEKELSMCNEWRELGKEEAQEICRAGLVNADETVARILEVGGPALAAELLFEVRAFQDVDPSLGEG